MVRGAQRLKYKLASETSDPAGEIMAWTNRKTKVSQMLAALMYSVLVQS